MRVSWLGRFLVGGALALGGCGDDGPPAELLAELDDIARAPNRAVAYASALVTM